jgi:SAM-dependent methyltransferase
MRHVTVAARIELDGTSGAVPLEACRDFLAQAMAGAEPAIRPEGLVGWTLDQPVHEGTDLRSGPTPEPWQPRVSAILSIYRAGRHIQGCLEDLTAQSLFLAGELEIVAVDSASPEGEGEVVAAFAAQYPGRIHYLRTPERETIYRAWNRGIHAARGLYLTNANADDRHRVDALERLAQALDEHPEVAMVYADSATTEQVGAPFATALRTGVLAWPEFDPLLLFAGCFAGPQPMWRQAVHARHGHFDPRLKSAGDYDFWLKLVAGGERFLHLKEVLGLYLMSPQGMELSDTELSMAEAHLARVRHWPKAWGLRPQACASYWVRTPPPSVPAAPSLGEQAERLRASGQLEAGLQLLLQACRDDVSNPERYVDLAFYFAAGGMAAKGVALLRQSLATFKGSELLARALERLEAESGPAPAAGAPTTAPAPAPAPAPARGGPPSICFINTFYRAFLERHYASHPELLRADYQTQLEALLATGFGDSTFYSGGLARQGWRALDVIPNCEPLQAAWRRETGFSGDAQATLVEQIRRAGPEVVYLQDLALGQASFLAQIRPYVRLIAGQIASPIPPTAQLDGLDLIFTSFPHFVQRFREAGLCAYYQPLAFDPGILARLGPRQPVHPFTFVGGLSGHHVRGTELLETVAAGAPLQVWGYGAESLAAGSGLRERHHGEAWGLDMFGLLHASKITLNRHIDVAERFANNMRLFEATGCGAMLLTDYKDNLQELFRIGEEIVAYRSPEECLDLVQYYLHHPEEAEAIAKAGQARTLRDHTYDRRMEQTAEILARHLRDLDLGPSLGPVDAGRISYGHQAIQAEAITPAMTSAWQDPSIPAKQRSLVQQELAEMHRGQPPVVFQALAELMEPLLDEGDTVLEVGCASGYYAEIIEYLTNKRIAYTGVDYSEALIAMARQCYPKARFDVADGAAMPYDDRQFRWVISSCVLLHTPNYLDQIRETCRVAGQYVIAHRTPVCRTRPTQYFKKFAYGVETVELLFNEQAFVEAFQSFGFTLVRGQPYGGDPGLDRYDVSYLFSRPAQAPSEGAQP